ncbi:MAG: hypothetical protein KAX15_05265 [Candidatus Omnitrophica bacterium]|nr:hypothetical protein [Candidatus Omnitrophota bacterium]
MAKKKVKRKAAKKKVVKKKVVRKKVAKKKVVKKARCAAKTKSGKACKNKAAGKSKYCSSHKK